MPSTPDIVKMLGSPHWAESKNASSGRIHRAIYQTYKQLDIDLETGGYRYLVKLTRGIGDEYAGDWTCTHRGEATSERVSGTLYKSSRGYLLFGRWFEGGTDYTWCVAFDTVERFPDEAAD